MMAPGWASIDELLGDISTSCTAVGKGVAPVGTTGRSQQPTATPAAADRSAAASDRFAAAAIRGQSAIEREQADYP